jgi:hypothetical protein
MTNPIISASIIREIVAGDPLLADASQELKKDRPFRLPKTHLDWDTLANIATTSAVEAYTGKTTDRASYIHGHLWGKWATSQGPIYCLSNELLRAFEATDADSLGRLVPPDWVPPLPLYCLALPNHAVLSPTGAGVPYLLVMLSHPAAQAPFQSEHDRQITITAIDWHGTIWICGTGLGPNGLILHRRQLGLDQTDDADREFLSRLTAVALQSSLALSYLPELVDAPAEPAPQKGKIQERPKPSKPAELAPRWIGKTFVRPRVRGMARSGGGNGSNKSAHWRRGHWRQQPYGKGRQMVRLVWIQPIFVGVEN